jgi:sialate O-acetylesterase
MRLTRTAILIFLVLIAALSSPAQAKVKVASIFQSHMVLQREMKIPIWGKATAGEKITVTLDGKSAETVAKENGTWRVNLPEMKAGGPFTVEVKGTNTITFEDVLIGEVWLCSGQSNMAMQVRGMKRPQDELKETLPQVRLFRVGNAPKEEPVTSLKGKWVVATPANARGFSAVAFFFGQNIHESLKVPVGLINSSVGGTPVEAWTSMEVVKSVPKTEWIWAKWDRLLKAYPEKKKKYDAAMPAYQEAYKAWKETDRKEKRPRRPRRPAGRNSTRYPANLYNGMIHPLMPYGIRGAIWYQGEGNAGQGKSYRAQLTAMIKDWRTRWGQGDFPFGIVQLPGYRTPQKKPVEDNGWTRVQEAELLTALTVPNCGVAVTLGLGEAKNIHPQNKKPVGERLAYWARAKVYGEKLVYSGPIYKSMKVEGKAIRLTFDHVGGGLVAKDGELKGFAIAGKDKQFKWASAKIDGDTIVVWNDEIPAPTTIRYAWAKNPIWSLMNKEGLPASQFRTDPEAEK